MTFKASEANFEEVGFRTNPPVVLDGKIAMMNCGLSQANELAPILYGSNVYKLEPKAIPSTGPGRLIIMDKEISLKEATEKIKAHFKLPHIRLALARNTSLETSIKSIAVCAGSGASVLAGHKADLWITGEMSHHEVLDAVHNGTSVVLCDHSNTERGFLKVFAPKLAQLLDNQVEIIVSEKDSDPLNVI